MDSKTGSFRTCETVAEMKCNQPSGNCARKGDPTGSCVDVQTECVKEQILYLSPFEKGVLAALPLHSKENAGDTDLQKYATCGDKEPTVCKCKEGLVSTDPTASIGGKPFCKGSCEIALSEIDCQSETHVDDRKGTYDTGKAACSKGKTLCKCVREVHGTTSILFATMDREDMLGASCDTDLLDHANMHTEDNTSCSDRQLTYCQCPEKYTLRKGNLSTETALPFCGHLWKIHTNSACQDNGDCADIHENISSNATCKCSSTYKAQSTCLPTGVSDLGWTVGCADDTCLDTSTSAVRPEDVCADAACLDTSTSGVRLEDVCADAAYLDTSTSTTRPEDVCTDAVCLDTSTSAARQENVCADDACLDTSTSAARPEDVCADAACLDTSTSAVTQKDVCADAACLDTSTSGVRLEDVCADAAYLDTSTSAARLEGGTMMCRCDESFCMSPDNTGWVEDGLQVSKEDEACSAEIRLPQGSCVDVHALRDSTKGAICQCTSGHGGLPATTCVVLAEDIAGGPSKEDQTARVSTRNSNIKCDDVDLYCRCNEGFQQHSQTLNMGVVAIQDAICNSLEPTEQEALAGNTHWQPSLLHIVTALVMARVAMDSNS